MTIEIIMPPLSQTMDSVVLVEWLKKVGEEVVKGEPLFVIETDKANLDVESPASGILGQVFAMAGEEVKVRSKIGTITAPGESLAAIVQPAQASEQGIAQSSGDKGGAPADQPAGSQASGLPAERLNRLFASPRARRLAGELGISLAELKGSGPEAMIVERDVRAYAETRRTTPVATPVARRVAEAKGVDLATVMPSQAGSRITRADVEAALSARQSEAEASQPSEEIQWSEMPIIRRTIARRLAESQQAAAEVTLMREVDATELVNLRQRLLEELAEGSSRLTYTDLLVSIVARQLKRHPQVNALSDGERIGLSQAVHVAVAIDTERGLVAPVIRDADRKGLLQLAQERADLTSRALEGKVALEELNGGTFTITNLGPLEIDAFTPIINPPQVAILGVGRVRSVPAAYQGEVCIRQMMFLSLTFDHRVIDGAPAARFLRDVARMIEKPHLVWL